MANRSISSLLTDVTVKNAAAKEKAYRIPDGNGLQLLIKPDIDPVQIKRQAKQQQEVEEKGQIF